MTAQNIGFIAGGQLGKMMIESFLPWRRCEKIWVLDNDRNCPCALLADKVIVGDSKSYDDVLRFGKQVDVILLEFEQINIQALYALEEMKKIIIPDLKSLEIIQDKGLQKKFFQTNDIPTAGFFIIESKQDFNSKRSRLKPPFIQKTAMGGYDGGGIKKIHNKSQLAEVLETRSVIEEFVDIKREFSLIIGRDKRGEIFKYPLAEQFFYPKTNIVEFIVSPAKVTKNIESQIDRIAQKILKKFTGVGLWAIELFEDVKGQILVNEMAPRPHNSGHHTIEANATSQFAQCIRLGLGFNHGSTELLSPAITWNLLGSESFTGKPIYKGIEEVLAIEKTYIHLYNKSETRPHRKMGHVTVLGGNIVECWEKIMKVREKLQVIS